MTEPRFILRTRGSRINPAIRASPVTSRSRAIPETAQFVTERTKRAGEKRVVDRLRVAIHAAKRRKSRDIRKFVALVRILDRKSTRLNSSHTVISYAVFCLKKKRSPSRRP